MMNIEVQDRQTNTHKHRATRLRARITRGTPGSDASWKTFPGVVDNSHQEFQNSLVKRQPPFDRKITSCSLTSYISRCTSTNCTYLWNDTCSSQKYPPVHGKLFPGSWGTRTKSYMQWDYVMSWNFCTKLAAGTATGGKYEQLFSGSDEPIVVGYSWKWCVGGEPLHQPGVAWTISRANYTDTHTNNSYTLDRPFQRLRH